LSARTFHDRALVNDYLMSRGKEDLFNVRSPFLVLTGLAGIAGAIWSGGPSRVTLRLHVKRGLSLRCLIFGHEDWVRHMPGRLYLECLDCGRETPGWMTGREPPGDGATGASVQAIGSPDRSGSGVIPSAVGPSERPERPGNQGEMPTAA
jgi:hypothetical protein